MPRFNLEKCLDHVENPYALVILAANRTRQLLKGSHSLVYSFRINEQIVALREIAKKKVKFQEPIRKILDKSLYLLEKSRQKERNDVENLTNTSA